MNRSHTSKPKNARAPQHRAARFRGASALLATAMLLLAFAPFQSANADSLKSFNAQWAQVSSSLVSSLGATDEATARVQSEQLFLWMQTRVASFENPQGLSVGQFVALLDEWRQTERGKISVPQIHAKTKQPQSSTRLRASSFLELAFAPQIATFNPRSHAPFSSSHAAAKLSGVRTNRRHE